MEAECTEQSSTQGTLRGGGSQRAATRGSFLSACLCSSAIPAFCFTPGPLLSPRAFCSEEPRANQIRGLEREHEAARDTSLLSTFLIEIEVEQVQPKIGSDADGADKSLRP